jgi:Putative DNA-binding domain
MQGLIGHDNFEDVVRLYNEGNNLDFKAIQYKKEQYPAFLKDIISMANCFTNDDRYIIIGVKLNNNSSRSIIGIANSIDDEAIYQQLANENIEPELNIEYVPYDIDGNQLMVFVIGGCLDKPYMMKKDFLSLKKGDCFVRKGSHQVRATRKDLDRMYVDKANQSIPSASDISIVFEKSNQMTLRLAIKEMVKLPSEKYKEEILALIDLRNNNYIGSLVSAREMYEPDMSFDQLSMDKLQVDLERADKAYISEDHNYKFGEIGEWINFIICNTGSDYVKDASIEITIPQVEGLEISTKLYLNNFYAPAFPGPKEPSPGDYRSLHPARGYRDGQHVFFQQLGDLRHHIPCKAFANGVSFFLPKYMSGKTLNIKCRLFGQNLKNPLGKELALEIADI